LQYFVPRDKKRRVAEKGGFRMNFFDKVGNAIQTGVKEVSEGAKGMTDIAKMKMEIKSKEDFIERQYIEIGKKVYETEKDADSSAFEEIFAIKQTLVEIEDLKSEILKTKGYVKCTACGADISPDVKFCPSCGAANVNQKEDTTEA